MFQGIKTQKESIQVKILSRNANLLEFKYILFCFCVMNLNYYNKQQKQIRMQGNDSINLTDQERYFEWQQSNQFLSTKRDKNGHSLSGRQYVKERSPNSKISDQNDKEEQYISQVVSEIKIRKHLLIFSLILLMTLGLLMSSNYFNYLQVEILKASEIIVSLKFSPEIDTMAIMYKNCPDQSKTFHVYINESGIPFSDEVVKRISFCKIPVLGSKHLIQLTKKWNHKFPQNKIKLDKFKTNEEKERILILLKQYFDAGTYVDFSIPYSNIHERCWKYAIIGYDTLFIDFTQKNEKNLYVPDSKKFIKVRFSYSPQVKNMIDKIIVNEDFLEECKQRQCMIIKCMD